MPERDSTRKFTPTPWKSGKGGDNNVRVYNARGTVICQFHNGSDEEYVAHRNGEANARFIVTAVNAHDNLLAALEDIAESCDQVSDSGGIEDGERRAWRAMAAKARDAVAKALGMEGK